jgi:hypothetical protein
VDFKKKKNAVPDGHFALFCHNGQPYMTASEKIEDPQNRNIIGMTA